MEDEMIDYGFEEDSVRIILSQLYSRSFYNLVQVLKIVTWNFLFAV